MKRINAAAIVTSLLLVGGNIFAAPLTKDSIQGAWVLEYTKQSVTSGDTRKREDTWVFKNNGTVIIKNIPRNGSHYDQLPVKYEIEDDNLKIAILGRTGRFDTFTLINKDDRSMTLKARFGAIYQFVKK